MKSIMEEASSVAKAIEKGWLKAGQPKEFSVKILEYPEKNFFGLTTKQAKIAILFEDHIKEQTKKEPKSVTQPVKTKTPVITKFEESLAENQELPVWEEAMLEFTKEWLKKSLTALEQEEITFSMKVEKGQLHINFNKPILINNNQNKQILKPLSQLLVQTLRHNFKKPLKGYKVIMNIPIS